MTKIPDTHLKMCQINLGDEIGVKQSVYGAPNIKKNLKIIVTLPGAKIIGKTIQSSVILGVESYGMYCALPEICCCDKSFDDDKIYELSGHNLHFSNFSFRIFNGINVQKSQDELKKYLIVIGIKPINNIVDIGNYVMLLTGQSVNIYDSNKLPKQELIAIEGYGKFLELNQKEYELSQIDIVITSNEKIVCLAGIISKEISKYGQNTKNVMTEIAIFDRFSIHHSSVALNLNTESSINFVHGVNNQSKE